jgi:ElaB/YqjD/DUF883 family membrane-anchored ribosome-binding protein
MENYSGLTNKINNLRSELNTIIRQRGDNADPEMAVACQKLDGQLNEYEQFIQNHQKH